MTLNNDDILDVELELTGICNLNCKLCANNLTDAKHIKIKNIRPLEEWIRQLNLYKNIKKISLAGVFSEPTLYPQFIELIDYLKSRSITVEIYTNGNTHDEKWWNELGKHLTHNDLVMFTICGSTQELHEKYRVGSNLLLILNNAAAFRKDNPNKNDWILHIKFKYNIDDFNKNMKKISNTFSHTYFIITAPYNERFNFGYENNGICLPFNLDKVYKSYAQNAKKWKKCNHAFCINCKSLRDKFISIDQFGKIYPCFLYRYYVNEEFKLNYSNILSYKYDFCYECENFTKKMLENNRIKRMI